MLIPSVWLAGHGRGVLGLYIQPHTKHRAHDPSEGVINWPMERERSVRLMRRPLNTSVAPVHVILLRYRACKHIKGYWVNILNTIQNIREMIQVKVQGLKSPTP